MCMNCVTSTDALAVVGSGAAAAVSTAWERVVDIVHGRSRRERRRLTWATDASFLASLGHDPEVLLGPAPDVLVGPARDLVDA